MSGTHEVLNGSVVEGFSHDEDDAPTDRRCLPRSVQFGRTMAQVPTDAAAVDA